MGWAAKPLLARQGCVKSDDFHGFVVRRLRAFVVRLQWRAITLYGATTIVASATRLLADRAESFGGRIVPLCSQAPDINAEPLRGAL